MFWYFEIPLCFFRKSTTPRSFQQEICSRPLTWVAKANAETLSLYLGVAAEISRMSAAWRGGWGENLSVREGTHAMVIAMWKNVDSWLCFFEVYFFDNVSIFVWACVFFFLCKFRYVMSCTMLASYILVACEFIMGSLPERSMPTSEDGNIP